MLRTDVRIYVMPLKVGTENVKEKKFTINLLKHCSVY